MLKARQVGWMGARWLPALVVILTILLAGTVFFGVPFTFTEAYEETEEYQTMEEYTESEPYNITEVYTELELYNVTEYYTVREPIIEEVPYEYLVEQPSKWQWWGSGWGWPGPIEYRPYGVEERIPELRWLFIANTTVIVYNLEVVEGDFNVTIHIRGVPYPETFFDDFYEENLDPSQVQNITGGGAGEFDFGCVVGVHNWSFSRDTRIFCQDEICAASYFTVAPPAKNVTRGYVDVEKTRNITEHRNVTKERIVTKYRDVTKTRPVTKTRLVTRTREVKETLFQHFFGG